MLTEIQAHSLFLLTHTQPHQSIDQLQNHEGSHERENHGYQHGQRLDAQLCRIAIEQPICACGINRLRRKEPGRQRAQMPPTP